MSNLEKWKAAKAAFEATEHSYNAAHQAVLDAGSKRSNAWEALVVAARILSPDEKIQAAEFEFGPRITPAMPRGAA